MHRPLWITKLISSCRRKTGNGRRRNRHMKAISSYILPTYALIPPPNWTEAHNARGRIGVRRAHDHSATRSRSRLIPRFYHSHRNSETNIQSFLAQLRISSTTTVLYVRVSQTVARERSRTSVSREWPLPLITLTWNKKSKGSFLLPQ